MTDALPAPLPCLRRGPAGGPLVLFLHGFMGAAANWQPVVEQLPGARCLAVDLPGHGAATGRPDFDYTMDGCVAALAATLRAEATTRPALVVGYSMGGRLALHFALAGPARCRGLLLESASPGLRTEAERAARRRTDAERARHIQNDFRAFLEGWYRMPLFASLEQRGLVADTVARRRANVPAELARSLAGMGTGQQASLWPRLSELPRPARILAGALDEKYSRLTREMAARSKGRLERVVIAGAGHNIHAERPARFVQEVKAMLAACA